MPEKTLSPHLFVIERKLTLTMAATWLFTILLEWFGPRKKCTPPSGFWPEINKQLVRPAVPCFWLSEKETGSCHEKKLAVCSIFSPILTSLGGFISSLS